MSSSLNFGANALINKPWRGPWDSTVNYVLFDSVSYGGSSWVCIFPNTNVTPGTDNAKWNLLAAKGDTGTISSVFGRTTAAITAQTGDYTAAQVTNALDMTATRPANKVLAGPTTGADAAPTFRSLVANDIPNIPASKITSGQLALTQGGAGTDLSITGGASQVLKQTSVGGVITVGQLAFADISGTASTSQIPSLAASKITSGQLALTQGGTGVDLSASGGTTKILAQDASHVISARDLVAADIPSLDAAKITTGVLALARGGNTFALLGDLIYGGTSAAPTVLSGNTTSTKKFLRQTGTGTVSAAPAWDTLVSGDIPSLAASIITSGQIALARGGTNADLSATGGTSQVLKQTTVGGNITVGQLAFSDISGSVAASQLPNPSASTLGGIESIAAVSHKWINSISTSGVPNLTQPAAADLSDGTVGSGTHILMVTSVTGSGTQGVLAVGPNLSGPTLTGTTILAGTVVPDTAGGENIGSASLPFANLYIGGAATNNIKVTGTATAARTFTLPDADSNPVQPFGGAAHQFITSILSTGLIISARPSVSDLSDGTTGSGSVVLATSPTLVTPTLGVASATSINKVAITAPATSSTLTIADGKTLTVNNTLTFAGTDSTTLTFQATGTVVNRDSTDTLTHKTIDTAGTGNHVQLGGVDLPASIGTNGQVLTNNSGVLAFTTVSGGGGGTPGGATNSIQYNTGSTFGGEGCLSPVGTLLPNASFKTSIKSFTSTGNNDIYTCPANKRAIITEITAFNGHASSSSTMVGMVKIGGVYYPATTSATVTAQQPNSRSITYILEAGETVAVSMTQQPFNVVCSIMEFDNTSNLKSVKITTAGTMTSGDNTVYTVPNGKSALVVNNTLTMCSGTQGTLTAGNDVGGITYKWNVVPSGGSVGTTNQISGTLTPASGQAGSNQIVTSFTLGAGDFISVNASASTSNQIAFITVVEM
jgi:hypothetical protein